MKRDLLLSYLQEADAKKVSALYSLFEKDISEHRAEPAFTEEQIKILDKRRAEMIDGKNKGITWQEMHHRIRNNRKSA